MTRILTGFLLGVVSGAALYLVAGEAGLGIFLADFSGFRHLLTFLIAFLSWSAAFLAGALAAWVAKRLEIPVAAVSVLAGTAIAFGLLEGSFYFLVPNLVYGLFAFFGGAIVYARRQERLRDGRQSSSVT